MVSALNNVLFTCVGIGRLLKFFNDFTNVWGSA